MVPAEDDRSTSYCSAAILLKSKNKEMYMKKSGLFFLLISYAVLYNITALAQMEPLETDIGGVNIHIPSPDGFHEISKRYPAIRKSFEMFTAPTNRLLSCFVSEHDIAKIMKNKDPVFNTYMTSQSVRKTESQNIDHQKFLAFKDYFKKEQAALIAQAQQKAGQYFDEISKELNNQKIAVKISLADSLPLGIFSESDNHLSFAILVKYNLTEKSKASANLMVVCANVILIKDKVIIAYVNHLYKSNNDFVTARSISEKWIQKILAANKNFVPPAAEYTKKNQDITNKTLEKIIRGALIGGLLGLIALLVRRWKRRTTTKDKKSE